MTGPGSYSCLALVSEINLLLPGGFLCGQKRDLKALGFGRSTTCFGIMFMLIKTSKQKSYVMLCKTSAYEKDVQVVLQYWLVAF